MSSPRRSIRPSVTRSHARSPPIGIGRVARADPRAAATGCAARVGHGPQLRSRGRPGQPQPSRRDDFPAWTTALITTSVLPAPHHRSPRPPTTAYVPVPADRKRRRLPRDRAGTPTGRASLLDTLLTTARPVVPRTAYRPGFGLFRRRHRAPPAVQWHHVISDISDHPADTVVGLGPNARGRLLPRRY